MLATAMALRDRDESRSSVPCDDGLEADQDLDLERLVWDPEYRREIADRVSRRRKPPRLP